MHAAAAGVTEIVQLLLRLGANINAKDTEGFNAFMGLCPARNPNQVRWSSFNEDVMVLLYAAGSDLDERLVHIPQFLEDLRSLENIEHLKHLCREVINKHLMRVNPERLLFETLPRLGFPSSVLAYMMYYKSLD